MDKCEEQASVAMVIHSIGNLMRRYGMQSKTLKECEELTNMHGYVLEYLIHKVVSGDEVYQKDVEERFEMRRSSATEMLQLMEKNGLIIREVSSEDKRMKRILLTQKAWEIHKRAREEFSRANELMEQGLSEQEKAALFGLLDKVRRNVQAMLLAERSGQ